MNDVEQQIDPNPHPQIPVSGRGDPSSLGVHIFERLKDGPKGVVADLVSIGPVAVNRAVRGVIEANSRLARLGLYLSMVPATRIVVRRPTQDDQYGDSTATVLVLILQDMD